MVAPVAQTANVSAVCLCALYGHLCIDCYPSHSGNSLNLSVSVSLITDVQPTKHDRPPLDTSF